jgi:hypothetical protein
MGRSSDGGIDGIIEEDRLGLDVPLAQAPAPGSCALSARLIPTRIPAFSGV